MHVTNTFEHILAHWAKYAILLFDAKDVISLFLVSVTAPVKLCIATQNQLIALAVNVFFFSFFFERERLYSVEKLLLFSSAHTIKLHTYMK